MDKLLLALLVLLTLPLNSIAQGQLPFEELSLINFQDTHNPLDTTSLHLDSISESEFLRIKVKFNELQATSRSYVEVDPVSEPDTNGFFTVNTAHSSFTLQQTQEYSGSYSYMEFIPEVRGHIIGHCGSGTCEEYMLDHETDEKMLLPASFDAGILGVITSPSKELLLIVASYDGPDYENYYDYRAEIVIYRIQKDKGVAGLRPFVIFHPLDWSIEDVVWKDDRSIALKTYAGSRMGSGIAGEYRYFIATIR